MIASRYPALGGLVFALCSVVGGVLLPKPPAPSAGGGTLRAYFTAHHDALLVGSTLTALAAIALLAFLAALRAQLDSAPVAGDTMLAAGAALVACAVLGAVLQAGVAHVAVRLDGSSLVAAYTVERAVFYIAPPFLVVLLAGAVAVGGAGLPAWLRALSSLLTALAVAAAVTGVFATSSAGTAVGFAGFGLTIVWAVCTSVVLLRSPVATPLRQPVGAVA